MSLGLDSSFDQLSTPPKVDYEMPVHRSGTMCSFSGQPRHPSHASINGKRKWTKEDEEELLRRGQSGDWVNIGKDLKRTPDACYTRYMRSKLRERDNNNRRRWTANDKEELLRRGQSGDWVNIGKDLKRTPDACYNQYANLRGRDNTNVEARWPTVARSSFVELNRGTRSTLANV